LYEIGSKESGNKGSGAGEIEEAEVSTTGFAFALAGRKPGPGVRSTGFAFFFGGGRTPRGVLLPSMTGITCWKRSFSS
jgi:hypothetical protein